MSNRNKQQFSTGFKLTEDDEAKDKNVGKDNGEIGEEEIDDVVIRDLAAVKKEKFVHLSCSIFSLFLDSLIIEVFSKLFFYSLKF